MADDVGNNDLFVTMPSYQLINTIEKRGIDKQHLSSTVTRSSVGGTIRCHQIGGGGIHRTKTEVSKFFACEGLFYVVEALKTVKTLKTDKFSKLEKGRLWRTIFLKYFPPGDTRLSTGYGWHCKFPGIRHQHKISDV